MNNFERIKQMSVDEVALLLNCACCIYQYDNIECGNMNCKQGVKKWLESTVEMSEIDVTKCEFCKRVCKNTKEPTVICLLYGYCSENQNYYYKQLHRYKQTLAEIKEITKNMNKECFYNDFSCDGCDMINGCTYQGKLSILQKISECEVEDAR